MQVSCGSLVTFSVSLVIFTIYQYVHLYRFGELNQEYNACFRFRDSQPTYSNRTDFAVVIEHIMALHHCEGS